MNIAKLRNVGGKRNYSNVIAKMDTDHYLHWAIVGSVGMGTWYCYAETEKQNKSIVFNKNKIGRETMFGMILGGTCGLCFGSIFYCGMVLYGGVMGVKNLIVWGTGKIVVGDK